MSGDGTLRRAASLMRERASVGDAQPWMVEMGDQIVARYSMGEVVIADYIAPPWADHIAGMHPAVALAVADWLDFESEVCVNDDGQNEPVRTAALAVARTYLGET